MEFNVFDKRCETDPQGVIKDLLEQTTRQAVAIHELTNKNTILDVDLSLLWKKVEEQVSPEVLSEIQKDMKKSRKSK